ncbi:uncharacterized protein N0V89_004317 [Didymosphaeria variabile]|uniref:DUF1690-domain-containing protein n=1 Tax=Didymosphaeria variabile TaxID=1932322 RepID=A0A9W8XRM0_9PLEO|nr:uncharacterized protein N0V89_004317 [Didymosphaeria variabile]KAJ4356286.1 hypothetical protein N0V89_004317 [Didymosphaeria variabile]
MGAENSKPASDVSQHVFSSDTPVRFSNGLVDSLQKNTQTDSTRSKQQELQYQQRLTQELEKLREKEAQNLSELSKTLDHEHPTEPTSLTDKLSDVTEKISDATSSSSTLAEKRKKQEMSNSSVTKEIEALKQKLEMRKKLEEADPQVNKAKEDVVACLRLHDRRPLDCWKEVEIFKREVGRLERDFVEKTIR